MKMKLLYNIISFTLVNVSVAVLDKPDVPDTPDSPEIPDEPEIQNEDSYKTVVIKTNLHIADQQVLLPEIVRKCINDKINFKSLNLMFSEPETSLDTLRNIPGWMADYRLLAATQWEMLKIIKEVTNTEAPEIENEADYENVSLATLGELRREFTIEAVKDLILSALDGNDEEFNKTYQGFRRLCTLIAMFWTIKKPTTYVFSAKVVEHRDQDTRLVDKETCVIQSVNAPEMRYEYVNGILWQLKFETHGSPFYKLSSQVKEN